MLAPGEASNSGGQAAKSIYHYPFGACWMGGIVRDCPGTRSTPTATSSAASDVSESRTANHRSRPLYHLRSGVLPQLGDVGRQSGRLAHLVYFLLQSRSRGFFIAPAHFLSVWSAPSSSRRDRLFFSKGFYSYAGAVYFSRGCPTWAQQEQRRSYGQGHA